MDLKSRFLKYYNMNDNDLLLRKKEGLCFDNIENPYIKIKDFQKLSDILNEIVQKDIKTVIYGDYDVDGMTSTSILYLAFLKRNKKLGFYIPSRYLDGYGLNKKMIDAFYLKDYKYIICVDNGISKFDEVNYAYSKGMKVIIIDHHEIIDNKVPNCEYVLHHKYSSYTSYNISAAFLSLLVYYALNKNYSDYVLTLAGIAVISDMMELVKGNLFLVNYALKMLNEFRFANLNLLTINQLSKPHLIDSNFYTNDKKIINYPFDTSTISFNIVSFLNSLGRMNISNKTNYAVYFLTASSNYDVLKYYEFIKKVNAEKKKKLKELKEKIKIDSSSNKVSIEILKDVEIGLLGGIINEYVRKNNKSTLLLTEDPLDKNNYVGSGRSYMNFPIYDIFSKFSSEFKKFGGHEFAFGLTIKKDKVNEVSKKIIEYANLYQFTNKKLTYIKLNIEDITEDLFKIIDEFSPYGNTFEKPRFFISLDRNLFHHSKNLLHLLYNLSENISINFYNYPKQVDNLSKINAIVEINSSIFLNKKNYTVSILNLVKNLDEIILIE